MSEFYDDAGGSFYAGQSQGYHKRKSESQLCDMDEEDNLGDMHYHSREFPAKAAKRFCIGYIGSSLSASSNGFYAETQENIQPKQRNAVLYPQVEGYDMNTANMSSFIDDGSMDTPVSRPQGTGCHTVEGGSGARTMPASCESCLDVTGRPVAAMEPASSSSATMLRRPSVLSDYYAFQRPMYELMHSSPAKPRRGDGSTRGGRGSETHQVALGDAMDMEVEPTQQDSSCPACSRSFGASDGRLTKKCAFCMKTCCEGSCLAPCDLCREDFCKNCSTPNYHIPHGQFICIDCSYRVQ